MLEGGIQEAKFTGPKTLLKKINAGNHASWLGGKESKLDARSHHDTFRTPLDEFENRRRALRGEEGHPQLRVKVSRY